ncbi:MAG: lipoyl domain-containing protein [Sporocytophaga sp.]|uniref:lipoyl domain-containing protein n=1 Tax=Sporocytophaga sp. TaxID=2231183 RepID=UPI001B22DDE0|nr:lipoyl domain-containing protein [Sporocytophaga sp.]MBO9702209.1 lipoyl domain-containing protein [Sporocytophaga sp.]
MFEFFKSGKKPDNYRSPEERELYLNDVKERLSNQYKDVHFKFILFPEISKDATSIVKTTLWKKKIGDNVKKNEKIAVCEADKVQFEINAEVNGILVFRAEKNKELFKGDIFAILAEKYVDLEEFKF